MSDAVTHRVAIDDEGNFISPVDRPDPNVIASASVDLKRQEEIYAGVASMQRQDAPYSDIAMFLQLSGAKRIDLNAPRDIGSTEQMGLEIAGFMKGSIEGTANIVALPFLAVDALSAGVRKLLDVEALGTGFDTSGFNVVSGVGRDISDTLFDVSEEPSNFGTRASHKIGEFVTPGAFMVKGFTTAGAKLAEAAPEAVGFFKQLLITMAKNPEKTQLIEAGVNAGAALAGEALVTINSGGDEVLAQEMGLMRMGAELTFAFGTGIATSVSSKISAFAGRKFLLTPDAQRRIAEAQVGEIFNEIMNADPRILKEFAKSNNLTMETGVELLTQQIAQNPELSAMFAKVISSSLEPTATRFIRTIEAQRRHLQEFSEGIAPIVNASDSIRGPLARHIDKELVMIQKRVDATVISSLEEARLLHPQMSPTELAEASYIALNAQYRTADRAVDALYAHLDNGQQVAVGIIKASIVKARFSPRHAEVNLARARAGKDPIGFKNPKKPYGNVSKDFMESVELNFPKDVHKVDFALIRDYRALVNQEITLAQRTAGGDPETVVRLMTLKKGIDDQLDNIAGDAGKKTADLFKEANRMNKELFDKFQRGFARGKLIEDLENMGTMSPESFWKTWIRPEGGDSIEAAAQFRQIFGNKNGKLSPGIEALVTDYVSYNLNKRIAIDNLDLGGIEKWLNRHRTSLEQFGIWEKFDDVNRAKARAESAQVFGIQARHDLERSELMQIVNSPDVSRYIRQNIGSETLVRLKGQVVSTGNKPAIRAFNREVWNAMIDLNQTGKLDTATIFIKDPDRLLATLINEERTLRPVLGNQHYRSLRAIADVTKRIEGTVETAGKMAHEISAAPRGGGKATQSAFSKIRASLQGFVSPAYTTVQLLNQGVDIITSGAAIKVIEEAMYNPEYALNLANIAKSKGGRDALRSLWQSIAISTANLEDDDERTSP